MIKFPWVLFTCHNLRWCNRPIIRNYRHHTLLSNKHCLTYKSKFTDNYETGNADIIFLQCKDTHSSKILSYPHYLSILKQESRIKDQPCHQSRKHLVSLHLHAAATSGTVPGTSLLMPDHSLQVRCETLQGPSWRESMQSAFCEQINNIRLS